MRTEARRELGQHLRVVDVPEGPWDPGREEPFERAFGLLVVEGRLLSDVSLDSGVATELLGPGDVFRAWPNPHELLPTASRLVAVEPSRVAVLDGDVVGFLQRWPDVGARLLAGSVARHRVQAVHRACAQMPRVEDRIMALLWMLGERWGRVTADGVLLDVVLTHELLGRLVGARRPTISTALGQLVDDRRLRRRADRRLVLLPGSRAALVPEPAPRSVAHDLVAEVERPADVAAFAAGLPPSPVPPAHHHVGPEAVLEVLEEVRARSEAVVARSRELVAAAERVRSRGIARRARRG